MPSSLILQHHLCVSDNTNDSGFHTCKFLNSGLWPKSSSFHVGHFLKHPWQLPMLKDKGIGPRSAMKCTSDLQDLYALHFSMWMLNAPSMLHRIGDYLPGKLLCNHGDSVLKMKAVRIQMFRKCSRDFFFFFLRLVISLYLANGHTLGPTTPLLLPRWRVNLGKKLGG